MLLPRQDKPVPTRPMSGANCSVVSCGVRLSEVGVSEIRKPQGGRVDISSFKGLLVLVPLSFMSSKSSSHT
jgi:hypothetical protein